MPEEYSRQDYEGGHVLPLTELDIPRLRVSEYLWPSL
jgi:hypothetical protein